MSPPARLTVFGDSFLDLDWVGSVARVAPDAPAPVLDATHERCRAGGAAAAAVAAVELGADVVLVTALGADTEGAQVHRYLAEAGVTVVDLGLGGKTPVKLRLRAAGHTVARVDWHCGGTSPTIGPWSSLAGAALDECSALLVSDHGRGMAALPGLAARLQAGLGARPVVWDPHPRGPLPPAGVVDLVTANLREAAQIAGTTAQDADSIVTALQLAERASRLLDTAVTVTAGARGAVLVEPGEAPIAVPCKPASGDACGARDRFAAAAAVARARQASREEAVRIAVDVARQHVLVAAADSASASASSDASSRSADAVGLADDVRRRGGTLVVAAGCFDVFHAGHLRLLETARQMGDCLIVCVNGDLSVRRLKGRGRPVNPIADRVAVLSGLHCVDSVAVFDENTPCEVLRELRPHIFVKGADPAGEETPERPVLAAWGGEVVLLPLLEGRSTTRILRAG